MNHKRSAYYYSEGLLNEKEKSKFESHLDNCAVCQNHIKNYERINKVIIKGSLKKVKTNSFDKAKLITRIKNLDQPEERIGFRIVPQLKWAVAFMLIIALIMVYFNIKKPITVLSYRGKVFIQEDEQKKEIKGDEEIYQGQVITTGRNSECYLTFGGNIIYLGKNTQVLVEKLRKGVKGYCINLDIKRGFLLSNMNDRELISKMLVKAGDATALVKGTIFMIDRTDEIRKTIAVLKGELFVTRNGRKFSVPSQKKLIINRKTYKDSMNYQDESKFFKILKFNLYFKSKWQEELKKYEYIRIKEGPQNYYIIDVNGEVLSLDKNTGSFMWKVKLGPELNSNPVLYNGSLYITSSDGYIYCVRDSRIKWRKRLGPFVYSSPLIYDGKIYLANTKGFIYAVDMNTQKILSEKKLDGPVFSTPVIRNNKLYIGTISGKLYCLDQAKGFEVVWEKGLQGRIIDNRPLFYKDTLYIGTFAGNLYNISSAGGKIIREIKVDGEIDTPLVLKGNIVYVKAKKFYAFSINGRKLWSRKLDFDDEVYYQDDRILFEKDNMIQYVDLKNGRSQKYYTKAPVLKFRSVNNRIFTYDQRYINLF